VCWGGRIKEEILLKRQREQDTHLENKCPPARKQTQKSFNRKA